jgi:hypothetical protein
MKIAIGATDDADRAGLVNGEAKQFGADQGDKYAEMCCCPQDDQLGVGDHRPEVRHRADAKEDQRRQDQQLDAFIGVVKQPARQHQVGTGNVRYDAGEADPHQQQRFIFLDDCKQDHRDADRDHHDVAPPDLREAGLRTHRGNERHHLVEHDRVALSLRADGGQ